MAGASFKMDTKIFGEIINSMINQVKHSQPMMDEIGDALVTSTKLRFNKETGPDGVKWKASKRAESTGGYRSGKTLTDYGTLKNSIGYEATPTMVAVGSNVIYAHAHQAGSDVGRGLKVKLPKRPYLGITDDDQEEIAAIIVDHITK